MSRNRAIIVQTPTKINKEVQCYPTNNFYTHVSFDLQQFSILPFSLSLSSIFSLCILRTVCSSYFEGEERGGLLLDLFRITDRTKDLRSGFGEKIE